MANMVATQHYLVQLLALVPPRRIAFLHILHRRQSIPTDGNFCGTTYSGEPSNDGTVFSLNIGLGPFEKTQSNSGKKVAAVKNLGHKLAYATSVTLSGTATRVTVELSSAIFTTETVQMVARGNTLSSNLTGARDYVH
jgi:hypothetical protein